MPASFSFLFPILRRYKPAAIFKPEIALLPPYPTGIPVSYATHALAGSAAHIQYLVNMIPACFVKFDLDGPHLPTCIKMYRYRHIPLFKLHSLYPLSCEIPHGMYCVVILGIDTAQYRIGHGDSAAHAHIAISLPQPVHSHVNLFPRTPTPIIIK